MRLGVGLNFPIWKSYTEIGSGIHIKDGEVEFSCTGELWALTQAGADIISYRYQKNDGSDLGRSTSPSSF